MCISSPGDIIKKCSFLLYRWGVLMKISGKERFFTGSAIVVVGVILLATLVFSSCSSGGDSSSTSSYSNSIYSSVSAQDSSEERDNQADQFLYETYGSQTEGERQADQFLHDRYGSQTEGERQADQFLHDRYGVQTSSIPQGGSSHGQQTTTSQPPAAPATPSASTQLSAGIPKPPSGQQIYFTETGKKYHYENPCGNGTYYPCTLQEALEKGLTPCGKCVLH